MLDPRKVPRDGVATGRNPWGADLFEPDALLPTEFFHTFRPDGGWERERLLLFAVLADGIECYQKSALDPRGRATFAETEAWLNSDDRSSLFAFETLCDALGIEAGYLRRGLRAWRDRVAVAAPPTRAAGADTPPSRRAPGPKRMRVARCRPAARSR
jgi:hypothetical protein